MITEKPKFRFQISFDWPNDGGLIREVAFIVSSKPSMSYVNLAPKLNIKNNQGDLKIRIGLHQMDSNAKFKIQITEENQPTKKLVFQVTQKPVWENGLNAVIVVNLPKVNPWHFDFPNLYRAEVSLLKGSKVTDKISSTFGFREIKFEGTKLHLNGEHVKVMGVEWTAGIQSKFWLCRT